MRLKIFPWLGQEFIELSWEGNGQGTVDDEVRELFGGFESTLRQFGLSLAHTVRTRQFCRDEKIWAEASAARRRVLSDAARSVSSSHVCPARLPEKSRVTADLLAMFPPREEQKKLKEYEPSTVVLRHLTWGGLVFFSGVTDMTHPTLHEQFPVIIERLSANLTDAGVSWEKVERASFFLHNEEKLDDLRERFARAVRAPIRDLEYTFVNTRQGKRLEMELTAILT